MTSPVPVKSQPLHNFNLPQLKWNKDGQPGGGQNQRRRTVKSPSRRPNSSSASPLRRSTSRDSISTAPFRDTTARDSPIRGDYLARQSPIRGEPSKNSPIRECVKHSKKNSAISFQRRDSALESEALSKSTKDSRSSSFFPAHPEQAKNKPEKKLKAKEIDESKRSKILIKLPCKSSNKIQEENPWPKLKKIENNIDDHNEIPEEEKNSSNFDEDAKIWNLRPRKPLSKSKNVNGGAEKGKAPAMPEKNKSPQTNSIKSGEKEGNSGGGGCEKKQKKKLSITIALTKQEIEEDIYALTGSKPARRPKKRPRNVQKQVDAAFPGLWLVSITPDSYKVSENSMKG